MKKLGIILLMAALFSCNDTQAQITMYKSTSLQSGITSQTSDTLSSVETTYFNVRTGALNKYTTNKYAFYFTVDTASGVTPVAVNAVAQGSYDGINWFNMSSTFSGVDGVNCDSLTIASSAQNNVQKKISCIGGAGKFVYAVSTFNCTARVTYARLVFVQPSGTSTLYINNVYLIPFSN
jgi:hypothetical protein